MAALAPGEHQEIPALAAPGEARRVPVLYVDTTRFFGPSMQVHGRVMRHLDPARYAVYLLADPQSGSAQAILDLAGDPNRRRDLGRCARQRAERLFYERRLAEDVMGVYEQVVRERSAHTPVESERRSGST